MALNTAQTLVQDRAIAVYKDLSVSDITDEHILQFLKRVTVYPDETIDIQLDLTDELERIASSLLENTH